MKIKTSELSGAALDWAVAKAEGGDSVAACYYENNTPLWLDEAPEPEWKPSTNWAQGGPIIEREKIGVFWREYYWVAETDGPEEQGETPLVAAMRCYVASKLGEEVEVPTELKGE